MLAVSKQALSISFSAPQRQEGAVNRVVNRSCPGAAEPDDLAALEQTAETVFALLSEFCAAEELEELRRRIQTRVIASWQAGGETDPTVLCATVLRRLRH
jgi:hypothetical protein